MHQFKKKSCYLVGLFFLILPNLSAQIIGQLTQSEDKKTYTFSVIPEQTITSPNNITNTAQITFKATTGSFEVANVKSINGIWKYNSIIRNPVEASGFDYIVFNLATPLTNPNYQAKTALPLFSFENQYGCIGILQLIENFTDEFWPPNALNVNIGTQLTILAYGIGNAYEKNDPNHSKIVCPIALDYKIKVDAALCANQNGLLTIQLNNGLLPFHYELTLESGELISGTIHQIQDSVQLEIAAGQHQLFLYDQQELYFQDIELIQPDPLAIQVIRQERITCDDPDGATVELAGTGGWAAHSHQFQWSNGSSGKIVHQLSTDSYTITLTDENGCTATKEINIEKDLPIQIDSIEMYVPTCHNSADGMLEVLNITNGNPPFAYSLNERVAQSDNYFENLKAGPYRINVTDSKNCVTTKRVELKAPPELSILGIDLDSVLLAGQSTILQPRMNMTEETYYNWTPSTYLSCADCPNPIAKPTQDISYTLEISNPHGCTISATQPIKVLYQRPIFVPNAISPNGDGNNDQFKIFLGPTIKFAKSLQIFNRWGQLVHTTQNSENGVSSAWDGTFQGKTVETGVYLYVAEVVFDDGTTEIYKGDFFLVK